MLQHDIFLARRTSHNGEHYILHPGLACVYAQFSSLSPSLFPTLLLPSARANTPSLRFPTSNCPVLVVQVAARSPHRRDFVLPDGVHNLRGYIRDPDQWAAKVRGCMRAGGLTRGSGVGRGIGARCGARTSGRPRCKGV